MTSHDRADFLRLVTGVSRFAIIHEDVLAREAEATKAHQRDQRVDAYRQVLPDEDFRRVVEGRVDSKAGNVVRRWLDTDRPILVLLGGPGTGKTVAAASLVADHGGRIAFAPELVRAFRARDTGGFREKDRAEQYVFEALRCSTLVVDDIGTAPEAEQAMLFQIVDQRRGSSVRTILTGNLTTQTMTANFDARTLSRLRQSAFVFDLGTEDMRRAR